MPPRSAPAWRPRTRCSRRRARRATTSCCPDDLYGGTYRLADKVLARWGLAYTMVDQRDLDAVARRDPARDPRRLGRDPDQPGAQRDRRARRDRGGRSRRARRRRQHVRDAGQPAAARARRACGGALDDQVPRRATPTRSAAPSVVRDPELHERVRFVQNAVGAVPGPLDCFLVHRGLRTLHLRMAAHAENGMAVSAWLREQPEVDDVRWPGLLGHGRVPPPGGDADRRGDAAVRARGVAGRRRVAGRGPAGHDAPVRRGIGGRGPRRPRAALVRDRGRGGPGRGSAPGVRRGYPRKRPSSRSSSRSIRRMTSDEISPLRRSSSSCSRWASMTEPTMRR